MHLADPKQVSAVLGTLDNDTRAWVEMALGPLDWLARVLRAENPFVDLGALGGVDLRRQLKLRRVATLALELRQNPFIVVGWTLRWRAEEKLATAYEQEVEKLVKKRDRDCSTLLALHSIATPLPPKRIQRILLAHREIPTCAAFTNQFNQRTAMSPSWPALDSAMFASYLVHGAAYFALSEPTAPPERAALLRAGIGPIPGGLEDLLEERLEKVLRGRGNDGGDHEPDLRGGRPIGGEGNQQTPVLPAEIY